LRCSLILVACAVIGCTTPTEEPAAHPRAYASAGDKQTGSAGQQLPVPLEVTVVDGEGVPVPGATVFWGGVHNGLVQPLQLKTDLAGRAAALFTLGDTEGIASLYAAVVNVDSVPFRLEVKTGGPPPPLPYDVFLPQLFATFEGSGETVHPDWALAPWYFPQHLAITPYPNGNANYELPSLFGSHFGIEWGLAPGAPNPIVPPPPSGHMSDPDLVWNPASGEMWMYYRQAADRNVVWLVRSGDGIRWSTPVLAVSAPNHELISPSVVRRGPGDWWMWSVNGDREGCSARTAWLEVRRSSNGVNWGSPTVIDLAHDGLYPWHVEVQWIPSRSEYWALYNAKQPGSCTTPALFIATSGDGIRFSPIRRPIVTRGQIPAFEDIVYRSTFAYDPAADDLRLWVSGARFDRRWIWSTFLIRKHRASLLDKLAAGEVPFTFPPPAAELVDWP
jgi:hypothetical protein